MAEPRIQLYQSRGFTFIELVAVLVLVGILGASTVSVLIPSSTYQLQSSRDQVLAAFFSAQQRAMVQADPVQFSITAVGGRPRLDIREDTNGNSSFSDDASLRIGGTQYPLDLLPNQTLTPATFDFDRLGKTTANTLSLAQSGNNVNIQISTTGFIQ
ncbi:MAG: type II secretion system GspH family protein [Agarilytica sp.]